MIPPEIRAAADAAVAEILATLARRREELGMTQIELARRLHTEQARVSHLENHHIRNPPIATLYAYAQALDLELTITVQPRNRSKTICGNMNPHPAHDLTINDRPWHCTGRTENR